MLNNFNQQMSWQDKYIPLVSQKLGQVFMVRSSFEVDTQNATDLVMLRAGTMNFAVRLRKFDNYGSRYLQQFTIRAKTRHNNKTEIHKILEGNADYGFYGWVCEKNKKIEHWTIFDLDIFRQEVNKETLDNKHLIMNPDGTGFYAFYFNEFPSNLIIETSIGEANAILYR
tara:strand:+ start:231 stop:740 length:510 start_codon:yes stop_codon:yes gene_type:complete